MAFFATTRVEIAGDWEAESIEVTTPRWSPLQSTLLRRLPLLRRLLTVTPETLTYQRN